METDGGIGAVQHHVLESRRVAYPAIWPNPVAAD
jgi:hypothetical protein